MDQATTDKIKRLEELLDSCRELSWQRAQRILELREENKILLNIIKSEGKE